MKSPILGTQTPSLNQSSQVLAFEQAMNEQANPVQSSGKPLYTGRYFVILKEGIKNFKVAQQIFKKKAGLKVASFSDFAEQDYNHDAIADSDVITYDHLGVALVGGETEQIQILENNQDDTYIIVPEKIIYVPEDIPSITMDKATWGLDATEVALSNYTGKNIKVAVLDTGFDQTHPDFATRKIVAQSFVQGEAFTDDKHGHGTHCIGTACGGKDKDGIRYGIASESLIYVGRVLNSQGSGTQQSILDGITWATNNGCKVISMSLGSPVLPGMGYDIAYERAAKYALSKGTVVIAAAGNDSHRSWGQYNPVGSPADCPSILAIAALDSNMNLAEFSNRGINPNGQVDIGAPGVNVYSSWIMPTQYRQISGTK
jgi:subtilisin family serine protease